MLCPHCGLDQSKCINSRQVEKVRVRKYQCLQCGCRYDTVETYKTGKIKAGGDPE